MNGGLLAALTRPELDALLADAEHAYTKAQKLSHLVSVPFTHQHDIMKAPSQGRTR